MENAVKINQLGPRESIRQSESYISYGEDKSGNKHYVRLTVYDKGGSNGIQKYMLLHAVRAKCIENDNKKTANQSITTVSDGQNASKGLTVEKTIADVLSDIKNMYLFQTALPFDVIKAIGAKRIIESKYSPLLHSKQLDTYDKIGEKANYTAREIRTCDPEVT